MILVLSFDNIDQVQCIQISRFSFVKKNIQIKVLKFLKKGRSNPGHLEEEKFQSGNFSAGGLKDYT